MTADAREHSYLVNVRWTGNLGQGTANYRTYKRDHEISAAGKPPVPASSDPNFHGDKARYNPEELLVASLSACHMLWYLHLCSQAGIVVTDYEDKASGSMIETADGGNALSPSFDRFLAGPVRPGSGVETIPQLRLESG